MKLPDGDWQIQAHIPDHANPEAITVATPETNSARKGNSGRSGSSMGARR